MGSICRSWMTSRKLARPALMSLSLRGELVSNARVAAHIRRRVVRAVPANQRPTESVCEVSRSRRDHDAATSVGDLHLRRRVTCHRLIPMVAGRQQVNVRGRFPQVRLSRAGCVEKVGKTIVAAIVRGICRGLAVRRGSVHPGTPPDEVRGSRPRCQSRRLGVGTSILRPTPEPPPATAPSRSSSATTTPPRTSSPRRGRRPAPPPARARPPRPPAAAGRSATASADRPTGPSGSTTPSATRPPRPTPPPAGGTATVTSYTYNNGNVTTGGQPNTLTGSVTTGGATGSSAGTYDADGNTTSQSVTAAGTTQDECYTYTPGGQLSQAWPSAALPCATTAPAASATSYVYV